MESFINSLGNIKFNLGNGANPLPIGKWLDALVKINPSPKGKYYNTSEGKSLSAEKLPNDIQKEMITAATNTLEYLRLFNSNREGENVHRRVEDGKQVMTRNDNYYKVAMITDPSIQPSTWEGYRDEIGMLAAPLKPHESIICEKQENGDHLLKLRKVELPDEANNEEGCDLVISFSVSKDRQMIHDIGYELAPYRSGFR